MKSRKPKFKGFRRTHWFVGDPVKREAHDGNSPLTRTWHEDEPVIQIKHRMKP